MGTALGGFGFSTIGPALTSDGSFAAAAYQIRRHTPARRRQSSVEKSGGENSDVAREGILDKSARLGCRPEPVAIVNHNGVWPATDARLEHSFELLELAGGVQN